MNKMPLEIRRKQLALTYWANLNGCRGTHPTKPVLYPCQEKDKKQIKSFFWTIGKETDKIGITNIAVSPTMAIPEHPPWLFEQVQVDLNLLNQRKNINKHQVSKYTEQH